MESEDLNSHLEGELELLFAQLLDQPSQPVVSTPSRMHRRDEIGPSHLPKQPRIQQRWHGDLQRDARALVIIFQVGRIELGTREVTFEASYEGLNDEQYYCIVKPIKGIVGHQRWLKGLVNPLAKTKV